jgi:hypothetical protein
MSVAFEDQGEIVPGLGVTRRSHPAGVGPGALSLANSRRNKATAAGESWSHPWTK